MDQQKDDTKDQTEDKTRRGQKQRAKKKNENEQSYCMSSWWAKDDTKGKNAHKNELQRKTSGHSIKNKLKIGRRN